MVNLFLLVFIWKVLPSGLIFSNLSLQKILTPFSSWRDVKKLEKLGLGKGGSLDNAIVVQGGKVLNQGGLRSKKEFANFLSIFFGIVFFRGLPLFLIIFCSSLYFQWFLKTVYPLFHLHMDL